MKIFTQHNLRQALVVFGFLALTGCAQNAKIKLTESSVNPELTGVVMDKIAVFALYSDEEFELRALAENTITQQMRQDGLDTVPGYRFNDSYKDLENRLDELKAWMEREDVDGILFIDPVRAKAFDPREHAQRRSAYRALGMDTSAFVNLISASIQESDASKYVLDISLWDRNVTDFVWYGIYDIKAKYGYDPEWIKKHLSDLSQVITDELKQEGLVR